MKYTDRELDRLLEKLIASTRSPRGKFSAAASYQILEKRLPRPALRLFSLRTLSAVAAIALLCFIGWNTYCYLKPAALQTISTLADTRTIKLPDGTEVTLNHFSSLTYPEKFKGEHREVNLIDAFKHIRKFYEFRRQFGYPEASFFHEQSSLSKFFFEPAGQNKIPHGFYKSYRLFFQSMIPWMSMKNPLRI